MVLNVFKLNSFLPSIYLERKYKEERKTTMEKASKYPLLKIVQPGYNLIRKIKEKHKKKV
jgi:hypothetical protein